MPLIMLNLINPIYNIGFNMPDHRTYGRHHLRLSLETFLKKILDFKY